ncbi:hypothetical protein PV773_07120 [Mesorhizobium sp. CC13]|uniref:hypothetical protein n=1 Tax=Mesorhizobium sp. CC13 TaxID=3029194 RepID=UPI003265419E
MDIWKWGILGVVAAAVATAVSMQTGFFNPFDSRMTRACEATLKKRLRSPSMYKRVEISDSKEPMSLDTYLKMESASDQSAVNLYTQMYKDAVARGDQPTVFTSFITYDAPNAYGTPVRGIVACAYSSSDGSKSSASEFNVQIDGLTHIRWLADQVRKLRSG